MTLTKVREAAGLTRARLGGDAHIHPARVGQIESRWVKPYPPELARLAAVLGWTGDPAELLEDVNDGAS